MQIHDHEGESSRSATSAFARPYFDDRTRSKEQGNDDISGSFAGAD